MSRIPAKTHVLREIATLVAVSLLLAVAAWFAHPEDFPLRADPTAYELDIEQTLTPVPEALAAYASGVHIFIDTRSRDAFDAAHIPGAMNLRPETFDDDLREVFDWVQPEDAFIVYGVGNLKAAGAVCSRLIERGYANVTVLSGDLEAWGDAGGEISGSDHE